LLLPALLVVIPEGDPRLRLWLRLSLPLLLPVFLVVIPEGDLLLPLLLFLPMTKHPCFSRPEIECQAQQQLNSLQTKDIRVAYELAPNRYTESRRR
jgi:hypothetical protein